MVKECAGVQGFNGARVRMPLSPSSVRIGTDCSGAEAPIWALRLMHVPFTHVFSCDIQSKVRDFIRATSPPSGPIFVDMLKRDKSELPAFNVYVCGFPCNPYSMLRRHATKLLQEQAAKPYRKMLTVLNDRKPALAILENVAGLKVVMSKILSDLEKLRSYHILVLPLDPVDVGDPVRRQRFYFVLVRKDIAMAGVDEMAAIGRKMCLAVRRGLDRRLSEALLPTHHPHVKEFLTRSRAKLSARRAGVQMSTKASKWPSLHAQYRQAVKLPPGGGSAPAADKMCLVAPRVRDAWQILTDAHPQENIVSDLSQNLGRCPTTTDGTCPTVTPGSIIAVKELGRCVTPLEKLLLASFPIHMMPIPKTTQDSTLADLGGNTMHLKSVGLALCVGFAMVDWTAPASAATCTPPPVDATLSKAVWLFDDFGLKHDSAPQQKRAASCSIGRAQVGKAMKHKTAT